MKTVISRRENILSLPFKRVENYPLDNQFHYVLYMPVKMQESAEIYLPKHLRAFGDMLQSVIDAELLIRQQAVLAEYIYLTVKCFPVEGENVGNRHGWHIDGYGTDDVNWIFSSHGCTQMLNASVNLSEDHDQCLRELALEGATNLDRVDLEVNTLHRLGSSIIHRPPVEVEQGVRTFVKISFSKHQYNLMGNAINPDINYNWTYHRRALARNHTTKE
jgi:hypothetical protein